MNHKLRLRILTKLAQAQTAQPSTTTPPVGAPPGLPSELTATLNVGYNADTVPIITRLMNVLNQTLHYASNGKGNLQKIKNNSYDANDSSEPAKSLGNVTKQIYSTFLNNGNSHSAAYDAQKINSWADTVLGSSAYNGLQQINPSSPLASKIQNAAGTASLKDAIRTLLDQIKIKNPLNK
jgi:hypothetical protein